VAVADLKVVRVVARRDLQRARPELRPDVLVRDDLKAPADERQDRVFADQSLVALVIRMDGDRRVGEHRLRPHGGDRDRARAGLERVVDVIERVHNRDVLDLEVRDGGPASGIPIDHIPIAVDVPLLVQRDEHVQHRFGVRLVEREPLLVVIGRGPEPLQLADDLAAVLLAPAPYAPLERLAAKLLPARPLLPERALDLLLRGDAGVVGSEDPLRALAAHPVVSNQRVHDRVLERVTHVQGAGDVRGRDRDRVVLGRRSLRLRVKQARGEPALHDPGLHLGRLVAGLV
jgi:hypothetical protein